VELGQQLAGLCLAWRRLWSVPEQRAIVVGAHEGCYRESVTGGVTGVRLATRQRRARRVPCAALIRSMIFRATRASRWAAASVTGVC
jgi:hypothetical protein